MLVLARKPGESIQIGDGITITVTEIRGGQVRIAVAADRSVPVHRSEVLAEVAQENAEAAAAAPRTGLPRPPLPRPPLRRPTGSALPGGAAAAR